VQTYKELKDPDSAKDYQEKLTLINQRREMIAYLNKKYGAGSKIFLEILEGFKSDPLALLHTPNPKVKRLITDTLRSYLKD